MREETDYASEQELYAAKLAEIRRICGPSDRVATVQGERRAVRDSVK